MVRTPQTWKASVRNSALMLRARQPTIGFIRMRQSGTIHRQLRRAIAALACAAAFPAPSRACITYVGPNFEDVRYADVVVIGRIANYRIIRDEAFRRRML